MNISPEFAKFKLENLSLDVKIFSNLYKEQKSEYNNLIAEAKESPNMTVKERQENVQRLVDNLTLTGEKLDNTFNQIVNIISKSSDKKFDADFKDSLDIIFLEFTNDFQETKDTFLKNSEKLAKAGINENIATKTVDNKDNVVKKDTIEEKDSSVGESQEVVAAGPQTHREMITSTLYNGLLYACYAVKDRLFSDSNLAKSEIKNEVLEEKVEENKIEGNEDNSEKSSDKLELLKKEDPSIEEIVNNFSLDNIKMGFSERKKIYQPILDINDQIESLKEKGFVISKLRLDADQSQIARTKAKIEKILDSPEYKNL